MHGTKVKKRLHVWEAFHKVAYLSCDLKINGDTKYWDNFDLLNKLKYVQISQYFEDTKMVDHILKISRAGILQ